MKTTLKFAVLATLLVSACAEKITSEGPALDDLFGEFSLISPLSTSTSDVDFSSGEKLVLSAQFSKSADWQADLVGLSSGAHKVITGKSKIMDASNATWDGSTTIFPMFREEQVAIDLYIPEVDLHMYDTVTVSGVKLNDGFLIADFESGPNPGWILFAQSGADMTFRIENTDVPAQGSHYYDMGGEVNWDWLIGYIEFPASAYQVPTFPLNPNPNNVYFNVLLYKPAGITNALALFQFREDDNLDGNFNGSTEDMYAVEVSGLDVGWNQVSLRYSDFIALNNGQPVAPNGNGIHEPNKIMNVAVLMLANPASGYSQLYMDYMIFTQNEPLNP